MSYKELYLLAQQANTANYESSEDEDEDEEDDEEEFPPIPLPIKRQTTQWIVDGQVVFNGNPNGDRLLLTDDDQSNQLNKKTNQN